MTTRGDSDHRRLDENREYITTLAKVSDIDWLDAQTTPPESAMALLGELKIYIPMEGLIDKEAEKERLTRELEKSRKDLGRCEAKLGNPSFVEKAPAAVVEKERARVVDLQAAIARLNEQLSRL